MSVQKFIHKIMRCNFTFEPDVNNELLFSFSGEMFWLNKT